MLRKIAWLNYSGKIDFFGLDESNNTLEQLTFDEWDLLRSPRKFHKLFYKVFGLHFKNLKTIVEGFILLTHGTINILSDNKIRLCEKNNEFFFAQ